ncbi:unnamed protein product [Didymodactylos carnosus]|uniref:RlpA-like protein double-psi beta-barrel domain-containing protein n=1 Tax=Didymodactylos carnosus TaxID=1234261 RepID=A0A814L687_9BILA|nr:unnamed protein product [Didymodactylos carnosus]CAF3828816.1 unnamed protein product [Didymodactylos carnosus]
MQTILILFLWCIIGVVSRYRQSSEDVYDPLLSSDEELTERSFSDKDIRDLFLLQDSLVKRANSGQATYYTVGGGYTACGSRHNDNEAIAALNSAQFDPQTPGGNPNRNTLCNRRVRVNGPKGSVEVSIVDRCPGCGWGSLDLSPSAFQRIAGSLDVGRVNINWDWI